MKPLSERDENRLNVINIRSSRMIVGMKPLSERDENMRFLEQQSFLPFLVGMKPLSERDENHVSGLLKKLSHYHRRNEATL